MNAPRSYACRACGHNHKLPGDCGRNLAGGKVCRCTIAEGKQLVIQHTGSDGRMLKRPRGVQLALFPEDAPVPTIEERPRGMWPRRAR